LTGSSSDFSLSLIGFTLQRQQFAARNILDGWQIIPHAASVACQPRRVRLLLGCFGGYSSFFEDTGKAGGVV
jgi:hypothetical protein